LYLPRNSGWKSYPGKSWQVGHFYWKVTSRIEFANADVIGPFLSQIEIVGSQASDYAGGGVKGTNYCYS
jgi:hypothetical protein